MSMTIGTVKTVSVLRSNRGIVASTTGDVVLATITTAESLSVELDGAATITLWPGCRPVTDPPETAIADGDLAARDTVVHVTGAPCASSVETVGENEADESTTKTEEAKCNVETAGCTWVMNEITDGTPLTDAVAESVWPLVVPTVHRPDA